MPFEDGRAANTQDENYSTGLETIIEALYRNASVVGLVEECQRTLQNPVQLINASFEIVHASVADALDEPDEKWLKNEKVGALQQECIENLRASRNLYKANKSDDPIHIYNKTASSKKSDTWICRVMRENQVFGYLVILECNRPITSREERLITAFARAIALALRIEQKESCLIDARIEKLVEKLLNTTGDSLLSREIAGRLGELGKLPEKNVFVLTVRIPEAAAGGAPLKYFERSISPYMKKAASFLHGDDIIFIASSKTQKSLDFFTEEEKNSLDVFLYAKGFHAAASMVCEDLSFIGKAYQETCDALALAEKLNMRSGIHVYEQNIAWYPLLAYENRGDVLNLCHPDILTLYEQDKRKGTELVRTLDVYLAHNRNINLAAGALPLHRNSLYYRIKKIETMLEYSIGEDSKRDFNYQYSILVLKYLGLIPRDKENRGD